jgi:hypothetical protein
MTSLFTDSVDIFHGTPNLFNSIRIPTDTDNWLRHGGDEYGRGFYVAVDPGNPQAAQEYARHYAGEGNAGIVLRGQLNQGQIALLNFDSNIGEELANRFRDTLRQPNTGNTSLDSYYRAIADTLLPETSGRDLWNKLTGIANYETWYQANQSTEFDPNEIKDNLRNDRRNLNGDLDKLGISLDPDITLNSAEIEQLKSKLRDLNPQNPVLNSYYRNVADNLPENGAVGRKLFDQLSKPDLVTRFIQDQRPAIDIPAVAGTMDKHTTAIFNQTGIDGIYLPDQQTAVIKGEGIKKLPDLTLAEIVGTGPKNMATTENNVSLKLGDVVVPTLDNGMQSYNPATIIAKSEAVLAEEAAKKARLAAEHAGTVSVPGAPVPPVQMASTLTAPVPTTPLSSTPVHDPFKYPSIAGDGITGVALHLNPQNPVPAFSPPVLPPLPPEAGKTIRNSDPDFILDLRGRPNSTNAATSASATTGSTLDQIIARQREIFDMPEKVPTVSAAPEPIKTTSQTPNIPSDIHATAAKVGAAKVAGGAVGLAMGVKGIAEDIENGTVGTKTGVDAAGAAVGATSIVDDAVKAAGAVEGLGMVGKIAGKVAIPLTVAAGAVDLTKAIAAGDDKAAAGAIGSTAGGILGGMAVGAGAGALAGTTLGPVGTAAVGVAGGIVGGVVGGIYGEEVAKEYAAGAVRATINGVKAVSDGASAAASKVSDTVSSYASWAYDGITGNKTAEAPKPPLDPNMAAALAAAKACGADKGCKASNMQTANNEQKGPPYTPDQNQGTGHSFGMGA